MAREAAIQSQFGAAGRLAALEGRKIEVGKPHRFFQFVDEISGEKDP